MTKMAHEIATAELAIALNNFADYIKGICPDISKSEAIALMAAIVSALPRLSEDNPRLREYVGVLAKEIRKEA